MTHALSPDLLLLGHEQFAPRLADVLRPDPVATVLLVDAAVAGTLITARIRAELGHLGVWPHTLVLRGRGDRAGVASLARHLAGTEQVVAVGGGSLLDLAKLATVQAESPDLERLLKVGQRSGVLMLPPDVTRGRILVAVPTTLGTGAEVSRNACLDGPHGTILVCGDALRPDLAVLAPEPGGTLPDHLIVEGLLEAIFRTVSPYIGDPHPFAAADDLAEDAAARLVAVGDQVWQQLRAGIRPDGATLVEILRLGGVSHLDGMHLHRDPFSARTWYLAHELSVAFGVRKAQAIAALLPPLWEAVAGGETRLGSASRLQRIWSRMAGHQESHPAAGIARLLDRWGLRPRLMADDRRLEVATARLMQVWSLGLPMLAGLHSDDVRGLLAQATTPSITSSQPAG